MSIKVFTSSWGQLEKAGSNIGDEAIFAAQVKELATVPGLELGIMSAVPKRTRDHFGAVPFDVADGRLTAMRNAVKWSDFVIVGGGELAQDRSSLLYTPYNLMPLRMARHYGKPAFAWSVGIGQEGELASWTPWQLRKWMGYCSGVTVRDRPSLDMLLGLGLSPEKVRLSSDSAFALTDEFSPSVGDSDILGVAVRNVSNRSGRILPLEIRRKLGIHREPDMYPHRVKWAAMLDRHIEERGGSIQFFPFHTGSLSNSDDAECVAVMSLMEHSARAKVVMPHGVRDFMDHMGRCRVFLTVPLHGAILSVVAGTVPVSLPYASKGWRFMEEAGIGNLTEDPTDPDWDEKAYAAVGEAWAGGLLRSALMEVRTELAEACSINRGFFLETCLGETPVD